MKERPQTERGILYTFYSYKGGVGRSMALANVAALLARWGREVLIIDWDLEAPGIEKYFDHPPSRLSGSRAATPGVIDLIYAYAAGEALNWRDCLLKAYPFDSDSPVFVLTAGQDTSDFVSRVQGLNWNSLFEERQLGSYIEQLRQEWAAEFDFVLIDSRTGITDIGGISTIHLPDVLVSFFTTNRQSLDGAIDVIKRARRAYDRLPFDRGYLLGIPVPARDETRTEYEEAMEWRRTFATELADFYQDWLPKNKTPLEALELLRIPYVPYWSFGERLPVVEEGTTDPTTLGFAYGILARLIAGRLQWEKMLEGVIDLSEDRAAVIAQQAEALFNGLTSNQQAIARQTFTRLVRLAQTEEDPQDTRRRATLAELLPIGSRAADAEAVIQKLVEARLLTVEQNERGGRNVEVAHEALIRNWPRLRNWLDDDREFLLWRQQLQAARAQWQASQQDEGALLRGAPLTEAERWLDNRESDLGQAERTFIQASIALREREQRREQAARRFRWAAIAISSISLIVALWLGGTQLREWWLKQCLPDCPNRNLSGLDLNGANLVGSDLREAILNGADLSEADLRRAFLSGANLREADLSRASLIGANLSEADLSRALLSEADLSLANLGGANLSQADLSQASLSGADLRLANLGGANLNAANLSAANLSITSLLDANLAGAKYNNVTIWPSDFDPKAAGAILTE